MSGLFIWIGRLTPVAHSNIVVTVGAISFYVEHFMAARTRCSGSSRKLVLAFDIGTTFSGAAYALLDPNKVPQIQSVTRHVFPQIPYPAAVVTGER